LEIKITQSELPRLEQQRTPSRLKTRSAIYLFVALIVQVLFWYFAVPAPRLAIEEPSVSYARNECVLAVGLLLIIPFIAIAICRDRFDRFPLGFGDYRYGLISVLAVSPVFAFSIIVSPIDESMQAFYPIPGDEVGQSVGRYMGWAIWYLLFYIAFEFFYRGFLLFGTDDLDWLTCFMIHITCCTLIHVGKPFIETLASIPATIIFAWITYKTRSIWYGVAIHFVVGITNDLNILWQKGKLDWFG